MRKSSRGWRTSIIIPRQRGARVWRAMESLTSGTLAGTGSFRCESCGYVVSLAAADALPPCPGCGGEAFSRASLFDSRFRRDGADSESPEILAALAEAAAEITTPGDYLLYEE